MTRARTILRGGTIVDGAGNEPIKADLALRGSVIESVGSIGAQPSDTVIDVSGRYLLPGFIDAHSHADAAVFSTDVQRGLLRQGVTTVVVGQDGVSFAPGDGVYATEYFGALNGHHPTYGGDGIAGLLAKYDGTTPINVGYLVPAGTVRHEVKGYSAGLSTPSEVEAMCEFVATGLAEGALGLSTGLDYVPNMHANTAELTALCRPVAAAGGIYVTHMRGGYEDNSRLGTDEVSEIALATGVKAHVSHYHGPSGLLIELVDGMALRDIDLSFDAYPYRRSSSLLAMQMLPSNLLSGTRAEVVLMLRDPAVRANLLNDWFPSLDANPLEGPGWPDNLTLAHVAAPLYAWAEGLTVGVAASRAARDPADFTLELLVASSLEVSSVKKLRQQRPYDDLAKLFKHPSHVAGSDGIYVGTHPHPRGWGTFARYLGLFTRERSDYSWAEAAVHLSGRTAERLCLGDRGKLRTGYAADVAVVDPAVVRDTASYDAPRTDAIGIEDVFVAGQQVLAGGKLTGANAGRGLRRSTPMK